jgi:2-haloacid dehalogenase
MPRTVQAIAFDSFGTLFTLDAARKRFAEAGLPEHEVRRWFERTWHDMLSLECVGRYEPMKRVAGARLGAVFAEMRVEASPNAVERILAAMSELDLFPDVGDAFRRARGAGMRVATLSHGAEPVTRTLLERGGVADLVDRVISTDEVRHYKPSREPYLHAAKLLGVDPTELGYVAAHDWDVLGARSAGLRGGWVVRHDQRFSRALGDADARGRGLVEVVEGLLALSP